MTAYDSPIDLSTKGQHYHHYDRHHLTAHHRLDTGHLDLQQLQLQHFSLQQLSAALANHPPSRLNAASQHLHHRHQLGQLKNR